MVQFEHLRGGNHPTPSLVVLPKLAPLDLVHILEVYAIRSLRHRRDSATSTSLECRQWRRANRIAYSEYRIAYAVNEALDEG